jgi:hypothetical protein
MKAFAIVNRTLIISNAGGGLKIACFRRGRNEVRHNGEVIFAGSMGEAKKYCRQWLKSRGLYGRAESLMCK